MFSTSKWFRLCGKNDVPKHGLQLLSATKNNIRKTVFYIHNISKSVAHYICKFCRINLPVKHSKQHSYKRQEYVGTHKGRSLAKWDNQTNSPIFSENGEVEKTKIKACDVIVTKYKPKSKRVTRGKLVIMTQQEMENMVRRQMKKTFI